MLIPPPHSQSNPVSITKPRSQEHQEPTSSDDHHPSAEEERQNHLRTLSLLDRISRGEKPDKLTGLSQELLDDPLDAHLLYVRWTLDTYASQPSNLRIHLLPILEQSTRTFLNDQRYSSDLRYLKLWALYARQCSRAGSIQIYRHLHSRAVGTQFGMFYEEWANSVELASGDLNEVSRIYDLGIDAQAQPLNRLKKKKNAVLKRMSENFQGSDTKPSNQIDSSLSHTPLIVQELYTNPLKIHFDPPQRSSHPAPPLNQTKSVTSTPQPTSQALTISAPPTQRLTCNLALLYPRDGVELSFEECKAAREYGTKVWGSEPWEEEAFLTGRWYLYNSDGSPVLYDAITGEPLFDYLKSDSSSASEMQLSEDGPDISNQLAPTLDVSYSSSQDQSMQVDDVAASVMHDLSASTDGFEERSNACYDAIADTEISIKLDSPARDNNTAQLKPRNRRASVTLNTQAALNDVYSMYGKPTNGGDDSDDNFDPSYVGEETDRFGENTGLTAIGVRDATADVTYWAPPEKPTCDSSRVSGVISGFPILQDENALASDRTLEGSSYTPSANSTWATSSTSNSRGTSAFKPTRKPLAPIVPFCDENAASATTPARFQPLQQGPIASGSKRVPLAPKPLLPVRVLPDDSVQREEDEQDLSSQSFLTEYQENSESPINEEYHGSSAAKGSYMYIPRDEEICLDEIQNDAEDSDRYDEYDSDSEMDRPGRLISRPFRFIPVGENFNELTPITERMSECNSMTASRYTNLRSVTNKKLLDRFTSLDSEDEQDEMTPRANDSQHLTADGSMASPVADDMDSMMDDQFQLKKQPLDDIPDPCADSSMSFYPHDHGMPKHAQMSAAGPIERGVKGIMLDAHTYPSLQDENEDDAMASPPRVQRTSLVIPPTPTTIVANEPCNPFDEEVVKILIQGLDPPLEEYPGYKSMKNVCAKKLEYLRRRVKTRTNRKGAYHSSHASEDNVLFELDLAGDQYVIHEILGEGAYGSVFKVTEMNDEDQTEIYQERSQKAMKIESPPNLYEYVILSQLHQHLPDRIRESIISVDRLYAFEDESFMVMDYSDQGTLLDLVNRAGEMDIKPTGAGTNRGIDELLVMFFVIELMRVIEGLHEAGYIHGDLKIDNCMIRLEDIPGLNKTWLSKYEPNGGNGWKYKGIRLIDYGRSIDTNVFPNGQEFIVEWETDELDCWEMRNKLPWRFQPDYYGIISITHCLLLGTMINRSTDFSKDEDEERPRLKRYHQREIWNRLFEVCLKRPNEKKNDLNDNHERFEEFKSIRLIMENWLIENCERNGKSLKSLLKKIEIATL